MSEAAGVTGARIPTKGALTREAILRAAADLASIDGLDGLSIAALAKAAGMSKAGVYGHFGSKLELQLATIAAAQAVVRREVFEPALAVAPGVKRVWAFLDNYIFYSERRVFPGGCFFANAAAEMDAKPGPLRDEMAKTYNSIIARCADFIREAQSLSELAAKADPQQLAFELVMLYRGAAQMNLLDDDPAHYARARFAIRERLLPLLAGKAPALPDVSIPKRRERVPGTPAARAM